MKLPVFQTNPACELCPVGSPTYIQHICIPTQSWGDHTHPAKTALLCIGDAPGWDENVAGRHFVGRAGQMLDGWLQGCAAAFRSAGVHTYLTNSLRCYYDKDLTTPKPSHRTACQAWLKADIEALSRNYTKVVILALGTEATQALGLGKISSYLSRQGTVIELAGKPIPVFATNNPAATLSGRSPVLIHAVMDHLRMLIRYLTTGHLTELSDADLQYTVAPEPIATDLLCVDVETYGIVEGQPPQNHFHPRRAILQDGCKSADLIQTAAVAWKDASDQLHLGVFVWADVHQRACFHRWMKLAKRLLFHNAQFDLMFLRAYPDTRKVLPVGKAVEDTTVWNSLASDVRPERSLKPLSYLLGVYKYDEDIVTGRGKKRQLKRYPAADDPELLRYNAADVASTLLVRDRVLEQLESAGNTRALSVETRNWYSRVIWLGVTMSEAGIAMSESGIRVILAKTLIERDAAIASAETLAFTMFGKGSQKPVYAAVAEAIDLLNLHDADLERTSPKTGARPSASARNFQIITEAARVQDVEMPPKIAALVRYKLADKMIGSYLEPLLDDTHENACLHDNTADVTMGSNDVRVGYTSCYIVRSAYSDMNASDVGGVAQGGRITFKRPALQTYPRVVQSCMTSRRKCLIKIDLSQIELRIAAVVSGDPLMLKEYREGVDRHSARAIEIFGADCLESPTFKSVERQVGKQTNFLIIYLGGPDRLSATLMMEVGYKTTHDECLSIIHKSQNTYWHYYGVYIPRLIAQVSRDGFYREPVLGQGRLMLKDQRINESDYKSAIANVAVQVPSANIMIGSQCDLTNAFRRYKMKADLTANIYDSLVVEADEWQPVHELFQQSLDNSWYLARLWEAYGADRRIPIGYEGTVHWMDGRPDEFFKGETT